MRAADLVSSLCRDDDVEVVDSVEWSRESSSVRLVRVADVSDESVEHDVRVLRHWSKVLRQSHVESHLLVRRQSALYTRPHHTLSPC